jgi:hypothetical protein
MTGTAEILAAVAPVEAPDPFDPAALRISPNFEAVAVKRVIVAVPVRKPKRQEFVRVHPDEHYRLETAVIELAEERETYLVVPALLEALADEVKLVRLHLAVPRGGGPFFWPVPLPGPDGRRNPWHEAAERAALEATRSWVRLKANMAAGAYDVDVAAAAIGEPEWPELPMRELLRLWRDELQALHRPPFAVGPDALFVAYYASAELGCFLALGWPIPARVLDLFAEFRATTNGLPTPCGAGLLGALQWHGLQTMAADAKTAMHDLVLRGEPWSAAECLAILDYCQADVDALAALLPRMLPGILGRQGDAATALGQALLRGRYMAAAARMEWAGVPRLTPPCWRASGPAGAGSGRNSLLRSTPATASTRARPSRRTVSPPTSPPRASPGRACRPARWRSTTTRSATGPRRGRRCSRCASCATPWASCAWRTWR